MSTDYTVRVARPPLPPARLAALRGAVERRLEALEDHLSVFRPESGISRFNASTSAAPWAVSRELAEVAGFARELARRSGGAFDPTLGSLIDLWGFGPAAAPKPSPDNAALRAARARTGWQHLEVGPGPALRKTIPGLQLNLGAVAKGYGADEVARVLRAEGCTDFLVTLGGETVAAGRNARGEAWRIGIDVPRYDALPGEALQRIVTLAGRALSTSGDYRNYRRDAPGRVLSHLLDGRTGRPASNGVASVTVIAADAMTADGLATALAVLGPEDGLRLLEQYPGAEALFLLREPDGRFREVPTPGFPAAPADGPH